MDNPVTIANSSEPIHNFFELSYAQYLTIPRSVLQSMPVEWQRRFVRCLEELDDTIDWRPPHPHQYRVQLFETDADAECDEYWARAVDDPLEDYDRGRRVVPRREGARK